jgi:subtilisin family serine protease
MKSCRYIFFSLIILFIGAFLFNLNQNQAVAINQKNKLAVAPTNQGNRNYQKDELVVKFKDRTTDPKQIIESDNKFKKNLKKQSTKALETGKKERSKAATYVIKTKDDSKKIANKLERSPKVSFAEPNYKLSTFDIPNDPSYSNQWHLPKIDAPQAWNITHGSTSVVIAVVDTGVDWDHPDLQANIWSNSDEVANGVDSDGNGYIDDIRGWDFVSQTSCFPGEECDGARDNNPMDFHGHGTAVSGVASAVTNNTTGVAGVGWQVKIMPVRAGYARSGDGQGELLISDAAQAIRYAAANGADIINLSWGGEYSSTVNSAKNYAYDKGALIVAAAGNNNSDDKLYPAALEKVLAVGATDSSDDRWASSNYGYWVNIAAPGKNIRSTTYNDSYSTSSGTSLSAPIVSGTAALIKSKLGVGRKKIVEKLLHGAEDISDKSIGDRVNARGSLESLKSHPNGTVIRQRGKSSVYLIKGGKRWGIRTAKMFKSQFRWKDVVSVTKNQRKAYDWGGYLGFKDGTLVSPKGSGSVFIIEDGLRRPFPNASTFNYYGYKWSRIKQEKKSALEKAHPRGEKVTKTESWPNGTLVRRNGKGTVFAIRDEKRCPVTSPSAFRSRKYRWGDIIDTSESRVNSIAKGDLLLHEDGTLLREKGGGTVYYLQANILRKFTSANQFNNMGYNWKRVYDIPSDTINKYKKDLLPSM